jgi:hypothetical protein
VNFRQRMRIYFIFPFFLLLLAFDNPRWLQIAAALLSIIGFILTFFLLSVKNQNDKAVKQRKKGTPRITFFFGLLYIVVAGLAITEGLSQFIDSSLDKILLVQLSNIEVFNSLALLVSFFAVAVLFFHGGITFLATPAANTLTKESGVAILGIFIVLFTEAIIIFFMGSNVNSTSDVLKLLAALMIIDISFNLIYTRAFPRLVFFQWFYLDLFTVIFVIVCLDSGVDSLITPALLLLITVFRTVIDYKTLWKHFYGKYPLTEM